MDPTLVLKAVRAQKGLTVRQAAAEIGISGAHLCRLENGVCTPSLSLAVVLQRYTEGRIRPEDFVQPSPIRSTP